MVLPVPTLVRTPEPGFTVAIVLLLLLHMPPLTVFDNVAALPMHIPDAP